MSKNYYKILGVEKDATPEAIKKLIGSWRTNTIPIKAATLKDSKR